MIRPPGFRGAAFGDASDGDARSDPGARARMSEDLGIPTDWAWLRQVHGARVVAVTAPGDQGEADGAYTTTAGLPLVVSTADCYPVILEGGGAVGVAHAGWRGAAAGVVEALRQAMIDAGSPPLRAAVGPGIGPCCFEVGTEVSQLFPGHEGRTDWGTGSVDLAGVVGEALEGLELWISPDCTMSDAGYHSHRRDGTPQRQVVVTWLPG